jgi:hypothetical protein
LLTAKLLHDPLFVAIMPFSKYDADAEHIAAMRAALSRLCDVLQIGDADDSLTEVLVLKIGRLAKSGELDPERLCVGVLAELDAPPAKTDDPGHGAVLHGHIDGAK